MSNLSNVLSSYADEAPRHLEVRPQTAMGMRRSGSEYRTQFVEHPFQEREVREKPARKPCLMCIVAKHLI
jgi:hypothetical protein